MKKLARHAAVVLAVTAPITASAETLFTGDKRLACEAILCLSTGSRPSECAPSLHRYFSIDARKLKDTIRKRKNFLSLCPNVEGDSNMQKLVNDIARGAGRCDAKSLNVSLREWNRYDDDDRQVIRNSMPSYCSAYANNPNVDQTNTTTAKYVGEPDKGGFWVDPDKYEAALAEYNKRLAEGGWNSSSAGWSRHGK